MLYNQTEKAYDAKKLASIGIIYSQEATEEKISLLFQNYNIYSSHSLTPENIKKMTADLKNIFCYTLLTLLF